MRKLLCSIGIISFWLGSSFQSLYSQTYYTIRGRLMYPDSSKGIVSASVEDIASGKKTISDSLGRFLLNLPASTGQLRVTHVSFEPRLIGYTATDASKELFVFLKPYEASLAGVEVSTGYQQIAKERSTGSFELLNKELLNRSTGAGILDRIDGVTNSLYTDKRRGDGLFTIRGLSSLTDGIQTPLIVLDNMPYQGSLENINPNDIESISILKDAAATSIWGASAANGVIVVTTRTGSFQQPLKVSFVANISRANPPDLYKLPEMSGSDFIDVESFLFNQGYYNATLNNRNTRQVVSPVVEWLDRARLGLISEAEANAAIDALRNVDGRAQYKAHFYQPQWQQQYAINLSGGSKQVKYLFSAGYDGTQSSLRGDEQRRITLRTEQTFRLHKAFEIQAGAIYTLNQAIDNGLEEYSSFSTGGGRGRIYPYLQVADENGQSLDMAKDYRMGYIDTAGQGLLLNWNYNPLQELQLNNNVAQGQHLLGKLGLVFRPLKGVTIDIKYQGERGISQQKQLNDINSYYTRNLINRFTQLSATGPVYPVPLGDILNMQYINLTSHGLRGQLNYSLKRNKAELHLLGGAEARSAKNTNQRVDTYGYNEARGQFNPVNAQVAYPIFGQLAGPQFIPNRNSFSGSTQNFTSLFANGAFTYDSRYTISGSVRKDASNLFGVATNQKGVPLWSGGLLWHVDKEKFYKSNVFSNMQWRLTYGYGGNTSSNASAVTTLQYFPGNGTITNQNYAAIRTPSNPNLRWERVSQLNTGFDLTTHNQKIKISAEYYVKHAMDLLASTRLDITRVGLTSATFNTGTMKTKGVDLQLQTQLKMGKLLWQTSTIFNYNESKITKYDFTIANAGGYVNGELTLNPKEGFAPYGIFAFPWAGLNELTGRPMGYLNGEISMAYNQINSQTPFEDMKYYGSARPEFFGAFRNDFALGSWRLSANITYELGHYFRLTSINYQALFNTWHSHHDYANRWQKPGDELHTNVPSMPFPIVSGQDNFYLGSEALIAPATHFRLQDIRISWQPSAKLLNKVSFFECFALISNLGTIWVANSQGIDPRYHATIPPPVRVSLGIRTEF